MRKGLLATGVAMIVLAIIVFAPSSWINQVQSNNVQTCNSFTGQLSQSLSQENTIVCNNAPGILAVAQTGMIIAIVLGVLGIALIVIGAIKKSSSKTTTTTITTTRKDRSIYCNSILPQSNSLQVL